MPRKVFVAGEILTAADVNTNLMDQAVMVFDDSAARGSAIPTPSEGMVTYLKDSNLVEAYTGAAFEAVSQPGILQVVQTVKTDTFTTTSASLTDITGLSVSITPSSASSKILVLIDVAIHTASGGSVFFGLARGGSAIYQGASPGSRLNGMGAHGHINTGTLLRQGGTFLDAPGVTSALSYSVRLRANNGQTVTCNRSSADTDSSDFPRSASSITVMEVAV